MSGVGLARFLTGVNNYRVRQRKFVANFIIRSIMEADQVSCGGDACGVVVTNVAPRLALDKLSHP
jgi:hypothetical protein